MLHSVTLKKKISYRLWWFGNFCKPSRPLILRLCSLNFQYNAFCVHNYLIVLSPYCLLIRTFINNKLSRICFLQLCALFFAEIYSKKKKKKDFLRCQMQPIFKPLHRNYMASIFNSWLYVLRPCKSKLKIIEKLTNK